MVVDDILLSTTTQNRGVLSYSVRHSSRNNAGRSPECAETGGCVNNLKLRSMVVSLVVATTLMVMACSGGAGALPARLGTTGLRLYVFHCGALEGGPRLLLLQPEW